MNESFLLGLASGVSCLASCGIVIFPYVVQKQASFRYIAISLSTYLGARLMVYLTLGLLAALSGKVFFLFNVFWKSVLTGGSYVFFSFLMLYYLWKSRKEATLCNSSLHPYQLKKKYSAEMVPFIWGIVSSLNLCPPLVLAFTQNISAHLNAWQSMLNFFMFFVGTAVYFIPLPFLSFFKKNDMLKSVGLLSMLLVSVWFLLKGILTIIHLIIYGTN